MGAYPATNKRPQKIKTIPITSLAEMGSARAS
jgi:hypothetical protein